MADSFKIELTPESKKTLEHLDGLSDGLLRAIAKGMDAANNAAIGDIQQKHLTGTGPFPVEEHRLGFVTQRLRGALFATEATVSGQTVESSIGDSVTYAAIHEFGGTIHREAKSGTVRLRLGANGELMHNSKFPHLAVFARESHKRAKEVAFKSEAYDINMPARAPIWTGLKENEERIGGQISKAIDKTWKGKE